MPGRLRRWRLTVPAGGLDLDDIDQAHTGSLGTRPQKGDQFSNRPDGRGQYHARMLAVPNRGEITTQFDAVAGWTGAG